MIDRSAVQAGKDAAQKARSVGGLGTAPITDISAALERCFPEDLWVVRRPLPGGPEGALLRTRRHWVAVVNTDGQNLSKQRFTAAHEGGHRYFDTDGETYLLDQEIRQDASTTAREQRANAFAIHFLLPVTVLMDRHLEQGFDAAGLDAIVALAFEYGVSYQATVYHLLNSRLISQAQSRKLFSPDVKPWQIAQRLGLRAKVQDEVDARGGSSYSAGVTGIVQRAHELGHVPADEARALVGERAFGTEWATLFDFDEKF